MKLSNLFTISTTFVVAAHGAKPYICEQAADCPEETITLKPGQALKCFGESSCEGKTITYDGPSKATFYIECYGEDSCKSTTLQLTKNTEVYCLGSESCKEMSVESDIGVIYVWGEEAFEKASVQEGNTVHQFSVLGEDGFDKTDSVVAVHNEFLAYQSAINSNLYSSGMDVSLEFAGYDVTDGLNFYCEKGSTCFVNCIDCTEGIFHVTDDSKLNLNCQFTGHSCDGLTIKYTSADQLEITGDGKDEPTLQLENANDRRLETTQVNRKPRVNRKVQRRNFERKLDGTLLCRDFKECADTEIDGSSSIYCDGTMSCVNSIIPESAGVSKFYPTGFRSARNTTVVADTIEAEGMLALLNSDITTNAIDLEGYRSGMGATIRAKGDSLNVDAHGVLSLVGATIVCEEGKTCVLDCNAYRSCEKAILDCRATDESCTQECDELFSGCAAEVPDCGEIATPKGCAHNKWCFWNNNQCKNREQASCEGLNKKECSRTGGVCKFVDGACAFDENKHPMSRPQFPIRV